MDGNMVMQMERRKISCRFLFSLVTLNYIDIINNSAYKWFEARISIDLVPVFDAITIRIFSNASISWNFARNVLYVETSIFTFYLTMIICNLDIMRYCTRSGLKFNKYIYRLANVLYICADTFIFVFFYYASLNFSFMVY